MDLCWIWARQGPRLTISGPGWCHLDPPELSLGTSQRGVRNGQKCHRIGNSDHKRWHQMAGSQWILVGTWLDTSRMACWCYLDPLKLPLGSPRVVRNGLFYGILELFLTQGPHGGNFGGSKWHQPGPLMVQRGPCLTQIQHRSI